MAGPTGGLRENWTSTGRRWAGICGWRIQNRPFRPPARRVDPAAKLKPFSTPGSWEVNFDSKPAISTPGSGRQSSCLPWQPQIEAAVAVGLSAQRIYQDLVGGHGYTGSYQAVKRFVRQLRQTQPVPFVRMEVAAGAEAQVDFGQGAWVLVEGKRKRPHLFRIVLSHSRKGYSEVVWQQTTESFIRCLENAFRYFGGVPRTLVIDNLQYCGDAGLPGTIPNSTRRSKSSAGTTAR